MNRLSIRDQARIAALLVEGNSLRGVSRLGDFAFNTVLKNFVWIGEACSVFHDETVRNLCCQRIEADEAWTFVYAKDKNRRYLPDHLRVISGTRWTWVSIDPDTRLIINWHVGRHRPSDAQEFVDDLADRVVGHVQLTTDQLMHYRAAVENAFGDRVDYATIQKKFRKPTFTPDGRIEQPKLRGNIGSVNMTRSLILIRSGSRNSA